MVSVTPELDPLPGRLAWDIAVVRICLIALIGLAVPIFLPQWFVRAYRAPDLRVLPVMLAIVLPWIVASLMLSRPRLRHAGLVLAASASIVALAPLVPTMAMATLLAGFMLDNRDQWLSYFCQLGATVVLIVTALRATHSARNVPVAEQSHWAWAAGLVGSIAYALTLGGILSRLVR